MNIHRSTRFLIASVGLASALASAGCAANTNPSSGSGTAGAIVLEAEDLGAASANLLGALRSRVRGMQVQDNATTECPIINFRGNNSMLGNNSPLVYLDGVRSSNTCLLNTIVLAEVDHVEIYSPGITPRPPFQANGNGLILVFSKAASGPQ